jgi:hypothetical protein
MVGALTKTAHKLSVGKSTEGATTGIEAAERYTLAQSSAGMGCPKLDAPAPATGIASSCSLYWS